MVDDGNAGPTRDAVNFGNAGSEVVVVNEGIVARSRVIDPAVEDTGGRGELHGLLAIESWSDKEGLGVGDKGSKGPAGVISLVVDHDSSQATNERHQQARDLLIADLANIPGPGDQGANGSVLRQVVGDLLVDV